MGGSYAKQIKAAVTHLITNNVLSRKYKVNFIYIFILFLQLKIKFNLIFMQEATEKNIKIFTYQWILEIWEANLKKFVSADDSKFLKFKCPVFFKLIITTTNLSKNSEKEIKLLISENGGVS